MPLFTSLSNLVVACLVVSHQQLSFRVSVTACVNRTRLEREASHWKFQQKCIRSPTRRCYLCRLRPLLVIRALCTSASIHSPCTGSSNHFECRVQIQNHTVWSLHAYLIVSFQVWHPCALSCVRAKNVALSASSRWCALFSSTQYRLPRRAAALPKVSAPHTQTQDTVCPFRGKLASS